MMRRVVIGMLLSVCVMNAASARTRYPTPPLKGERLYIAQIVGKEKSEDDDRLTTVRLMRAIMVIDIDHDGIPDYMVDHNKVINTHWCGTGGCDFELWRGMKAGHPVRVWNQMVREYSIAYRGGETVFDFDFHGSNCGTFGASACPASFAWDGIAHRMVERPTPTGDTTLLLINPMPLKRADVPPNIMAISLADSAKCKANGSSDEVSLPTSIPDVDGDGLRDWSLIVAACDKPDAYELQQMLFVTSGNAKNPSVAASGGSYHLSFCTKPLSVARVNETENCGGFSVDGNVCTQTPMVWNATAKKLEIAVP